MSECITKFGENAPSDVSIVSAPHGVVVLIGRQSDLDVAEAMLEFSQALALLRGKRALSVLTEVLRQITTDLRNVSPCECPKCKATAHGYAIAMAELQTRRASRAAATTH